MSRHWLTYSVVTIAITAACQQSPDQSASGDSSIVTLKDIHTFPKSEAIVRIDDMVVGKDGTVYVQNSTEPFFLAFSSDGTKQWSWGRRGNGPSEFQNPTGLVISSTGDQVLAYDNPRPKFVTVAHPDREHPEFWIGDGSSRVGMPSLMYFEGGIAWFGAAGNDPIAAVQEAGTSGTPALWRSKLVQFNRDGTPRTRLEIARYVGDPEKLYPGATELIPFPLWAVCQDGSYAIYDPAVNVIRRLDSGGVATDSILLPPERRVPVTFDRVYSMFSAVVLREREPSEAGADTMKAKEDLRGRFEGAKNVFWKNFPEYADLRCAPDKSLWIQVFDPESGRMGKSHRWVHLNSGKVRQVTLLPSFRPMFFSSDRIWGRYQDDEGLESVAWVEVPR